ncbi:LPS assembly protein LptD [Opitutus terrae]|uniref:Organic solvent tolerance protein n=1 Tax=Opitutus terrae (strain DSM 11246 / JCM 15787 / PB90-1) TaxID=452637 RepID=B1ZZ47_OPITP|nr:LPS assembly protein LptD [Opitutus terrae]ACB77119.1 Organic solvent tolerance protein [Opitutus terrae PB90-1]
MIRRLLACLFVASPLVAAPAPDATSIVAGLAQTSTVTGETILTGNPHVDYGDLRLRADEIRIDPQTKIATARGHAVLTQGPRRLLADVITYHAADGTYTVGELRVGEFPIYISGSSATGSREQIVINDARVTVPEPGPFVPTLHAARLQFTADKQLHAERASAGIGPVRPVALRGFDQDLRSPMLPNLSLTAGYRRSLGAFIVAGLRVPILPQLQLGGDLGLYSSRGIMAGPSGSYEGGNETVGYRGDFRSGFISDYGTRYTDILGRAIPRNRGFATWQHQQHITDRLALTGELNYWRDSEVLRDFRPGEFFPVQQPDTFLESTYAGDNYFVSLFARFQPNSFQVVQQRLPELRFDLLPITLPGGFVERFNASVAVLREDPLPAAPYTPALNRRLRSDRFDAYYGLSRPIRPTDWFAFTPVAGGRITHYANLDGARNDYTRTLGEVGFDAELRTSGTFDYKNPRWKIDGLRHLLTPRVSYRYIPEAEKGARYIPPIDRRSFSTYLQPLGLGDIRNIDELRGTSTLRFGLDNTLQTRDPDYGSRDLVVFNVANDLRFERDPDERDVSEIHTELAVMPARWLELGVYQSFRPQDFTLREFNTGVTLRSGDDWAVRFSSNFLRRELEDYFLEGQRRINEVFEGIVRLRYDARQDRFIEQIYGIRQNIANTWSVDYTISLYGGNRRESRFGLNIRIDAIRF